MTDNFIKFGIAPICTAAVAILVARTSRSHESEKETRRRRQDLLERIVAEFEVAHQAVNDAISNIKIAAARAEIIPAERTNETIAPMRRNLGLVQARLILMRLDPAEAEFRAYKSKMQDLLTEVLRKRPYENQTNEWLSARETFLEVLSRSFDQ